MDGATELLFYVNGCKVSASAGGLGALAPHGAARTASCWVALRLRALMQAPALLVCEKACSCVPTCTPRAGKA